LKYQFNKSSIYIDGTDIPKNRFGIKDANFIHTLEKKLLHKAYSKFSSELNSKTLLNEEYFINLHKKTFESLYDFAGIYRDVNMAKGDSQFCLAKHLHTQSKLIFDKLESENYLIDVKDNKLKFAQKMAYYQGELIALHPFYELNGRVIRLYCDMLAIKNGYKPINYEDTIKDSRYIQASIDAVQYADVSKLEEIIFNGLVKNR